jgi:protein tyrosine phosphatase (PTP) superfamily phosphohydrolase (DUF442 family)
MSELLRALAGVPNITEPVPGLLAGGQPSAAHLAAFKAAGGIAVIDMRDPMEPRPYRTPDAVRAAGLEYYNIAVPHDRGDDATLGVIRERLAQLLARGPVLAHCASGNRTGATLIPYFMIDKGMPEDEAITAAMRIGTRNAELIEWGLDYARGAEP